MLLRLKMSFGLFRAASVLVLVAWTPSRATATHPAAEPPKPLPEKVVKAWKDAGGFVGWMRFTYSQHVQFSTAKGTPGDIPAFQFSGGKVGRTAPLPEPEVGFGLSLEGSHLSDAGLKELARFTRLRALNLSRTKVTDAGLEALSRLRGLQVLHLNDLDVGDRGLRNLGELTSLRRLDLDRTKVTDAGVKGLAEFQALQVLSLAGTPVTDGGLRQLHRQRNLEALYVGGTQVTGSRLICARRGTLANRDSLHAKRTAIRC